MANYSNLKAAIADVIKTNGTKAITGQVLQDTLNSIVSVIGANYQFAGVATPSTNPGTPDQNVFYIAMQGGTYTNFNATALPEGISLLMWNGSWSSQVISYNDGGVFDISVYKSTGGTLATFADLAAALGTNGANVPVAARKGGMSVRFVQSSDNKYVQYRLMADTFNTTVANWQGVDDVPIVGSDNLVKSGGVADALNNIKNAIYDNSILKGVEITDGGYINPSNGNVVALDEWCYTDYIAIKPDTDYGPIVFCAWYDENKNRVGGVQDAERGTHTSPSTAKYARFSEEIKYKESWAIAEGGNFVSGWQKEILSPNLIKKTTVTDGGFVYAGNIISDANWCYTDYMPITAEKYYGKLRIACWYTYNKTYISTVQSEEGVVRKAPSNAAFLRASIPITEKSLWSITENGEDDTIEGKTRENTIRINNLEANQAKEIHIGAGYDYTSFSEGIAAASQANNPTVYVHSGTYDLINENQTKATAGQNLVVINRSMRIIFDPDAKLTALFNSSYEYYKGCSPIHLLGNANITFEGMNIECSNCLYCVHDESYGNYTYTHKFINCNMKMITENTDGALQCIGGGLGRFCNIIIDGGVYETDTSSWDEQGNNELVISYHNGVNNNDNKSVIYVKDVYLKHKGKMRFTHCGQTTLMTDVYVSNCSMGADIIIAPEGQYYYHDNMQLFSWNNVVRN